MDMGYRSGMSWLRLELWIVCMSDDADKASANVQVHVATWRASKRFLFEKLDSGLRGFERDCEAAIYDHDERGDHKEKHERRWKRPSAGDSEALS